MDELSDVGGESHTHPQTKRSNLFRTGFTPPWDLLQVLSWFIYALVSGYLIWIIVANKVGVSYPVTLVVVKSCATFLAGVCAVWVTCSDPTDELFYKSLDPYKA